MKMIREDHHGINLEWHPFFGVRKGAAKKFNCQWIGKNRSALECDQGKEVSASRNVYSAIFHRGIIKYCWVSPALFWRDEDV